MITLNEAREYFEYDLETGKLLCKKIDPYTRQRLLGREVGHVNTKGYRVVKFKGRAYKAHRLVWFMIAEEWPKNQIDHINGNKDDNRIENLRVTTNRQNKLNSEKHRAGHLPGAYYHNVDGNWTSRIRVGNKRVSLGYFKTKEEAHLAYLKALEIVCQSE